MAVYRRTFNEQTIQFWEKENMNQYAQPSATPSAVGYADQDIRAKFIMKTYHHLFGSIILFVLIEMMLFKTGAAESMARFMLGTSWMIFLGAFMVVGWLASHTAHSAQTKGVQYAALIGFVVAEAVIFVPLLWLANSFAPGAINSAAVVTMMGFTGLTAVAWFTRKDFSFLGAFLKWAMIVALVAIVGGAIFGFQLGTWFMVLMVGLAGAAILYDTSNILHHYSEDRYVGAALSLFSSVMMMFWYVLQLFMSRD